MSASDPTDIHAVKHDDAPWHYGGDFPIDLPIEAPLLIRGYSMSDPGFPALACRPAAWSLRPRVHATSTRVQREGECPFLAKPDTGLARTTR